METQINAKQRQAITEAMMAQQMSGQTSLGPSPYAQQSLFSADILDEIFTFHKWSPEQVERGNAIRAAAKAAAAAALAEQDAVKAFIKAMQESAPEPLPVPVDPLAGKLNAVALSRRANALNLSAQLVNQKLTDDKIEFVSKLVMEINSAITFEAAAVAAEVAE